VLKTEIFVTRPQCVKQELLKRQYVVFGSECVNTFITILYMYMFRAISCPSSEGQIILIHGTASGIVTISKRPSGPVHRTVTY
jgi:hypothetical protein